MFNFLLWMQTFIQLYSIFKLTVVGSLPSERKKVVWCPEFPVANNFFQQSNPPPNSPPHLAVVVVVGWW